MGKPMLVYGLKLVEMPQAIAAEPVPSLVRLQPLDLCLGEWVDTPSRVVESLQKFRALGLGGISVDVREPGNALDVARQRSSCVRKSKLESEVVEVGAEVVDAVSGDEAQAGWRRLEDLRPNDLLAALGLEFGPKSVRAFFTPSSSFCFKTLQMVERPVQPPLVVKGHSWSNGSVMAETRDKQLIREGEPSQLTEKELEMPVSGDVGFFDALDKASITLTS